MNLTEKTASWMSIWYAIWLVAMLYVAMMYGLPYFLLRRFITSAFDACIIFFNLKWNFNYFLKRNKSKANDNSATRISNYIFSINVHLRRCIEETRSRLCRMNVSVLEVISNKEIFWKCHRPFESLDICFCPIELQSFGTGCFWCGPKHPISQMHWNLQTLVRNRHSPKFETKLIRWSLDVLAWNRSVLKMYKMNVSTANSKNILDVVQQLKIRGDFCFLWKSPILCYHSIIESLTKSGKQWMKSRPLSSSS